MSYMWNWAEAESIGGNLVETLYYWGTRTNSPKYIVRVTLFVKLEKNI